MAATARVIWLCACVRYCRPQGWCLSVTCFSRVWRNKCLLCRLAQRRIRRNVSTTLPISVLTCHANVLWLITSRNPRSWGRLRDVTSQRSYSYMLACFNRLAFSTGIVYPAEQSRAWSKDTVAPILQSVFLPISPHIASLWIKGASHRSS